MACCRDGRWDISLLPGLSHESARWQVTFAEQLGAAKHQAQSEGEVSSKNEAKKLAFYLFWNIKPYFDRSYILPEDLEHFLPRKKAAQVGRLLQPARCQCADAAQNTRGKQSCQASSWPLAMNLVTMQWNWYLVAWITWLTP